MKKQSNLSRLMQYAGKFRYLTMLSWLLSAVSAILALVPFWYIWSMMKEVLRVSPNYNLAQNLPYMGIMAVIAAIVSVLIYIAGLMCSHIAAFRVASNMRSSMMHHMVKLPLGALDEIGSGKLRKTVQEASAATETYLAHQLPDKAGAIATPFALLVLLLSFDWRLGLLSLVPVVLGFSIMMAMTGTGMQEKMQEYQNALDDMANEAVEYVRGIPVVKTFGQTVFSFKKFKQSIDRYGIWVIAYTKQLRKPMLCYTTAINSVFVFLIIGAIWICNDGVDTTFLLNLMFYIIVTPVISLTLTKIMFQSENAMIVQDALSRMDRILEIQPLPQESKMKQYADYRIALRNVSFQYQKDRDAIHHVSLDIPSGTCVAFVGPSGSGKTTLANLISRFYDPYEGSIQIGGIDVKEIPKEQLMDTISYVFQNSHLIKASILDNVRLAKPEATRDEVMQALESAQCMDIIKKLPLGADTIIGSKGIYLSGGEMQRIAIARVMLKNTPIIILDEATAFADPDNEQRVQIAFQELCKGKTVLMIAHRLSTIVNCDQIFVLSNGEIVEQGTSRILLKQHGLFANMWDNYQTSIEWKVAKEGQL